MNTQRERLQSHLDKGSAITRLTAFNQLGIVELSSRMGELIKRGYPISKRWIKVTNRFGEGVRVMEYKREKQQQR